MNVVTFNNDFRNVMENYWNPQAIGLGKNKQKIIQRVLSSPLFEHTDGVDLWQKVDHQHCFKGALPLTPYSEFRLNETVSYQVKENRVLTMVVDLVVLAFDYPRYGSLMQFFAIFRKFKLSNGKSFEPRTICWIFTTSEKSQNINGVAIDVEDNFIYDRVEDIEKQFEHDGIKWIPEEFEPVHSSVKFAPASYVEEMISKFCIDCMNPQIHMIQTHPNPRGRSVEWLAPRTHYVLLHKAHVHRFRKSESGLKEAQSEGSIQRIAHARRAHTRLLKSPKFRHKQGQEIHIRSTWIGPKEWSDKSGQIYKFMERSNITIQPKKPDNPAANGDGNQLSNPGIPCLQV